MPVRIVTSGGEPVREVARGGDPVRIVTEGVSDPVRGISAAPPPPPSSDCLVVTSATCLLCLQADALVLNDGDPVSVWADASGQGHHFTQTGAARPTYRVGGGIPYIEFPSGGGQFLLGQNWAAMDSLDSFTVFAVHEFTYLPEHYYSLVLKKFDNVTGIGWEVDTDYFLLVSTDYSNYIQVFQVGAGAPFVYGDRHVIAHEKLSNIDLKLWVDGIQVGSLGTVGDGVSSFSNSEPLEIGNDYIHELVTPYNIYSVMVYSPAPNASDRAAIEAWLAAKYGVTLP